MGGVCRLGIGEGARLGRWPSQTVMAGPIRLRAWGTMSKIDSNTLCHIYPIGWICFVLRRRSELGKNG